MKEKHKMLGAHYKKTKKTQNLIQLKEGIVWESFLPGIDISAEIWRMNKT